jgi:hypothetical protein
VSWCFNSLPVSPEPPQTARPHTKELKRWLDENHDDYEPGRNESSNSGQGCHPDPAPKCYLTTVRTRGALNPQPSTLNVHRTGRRRRRISDKSRATGSSSSFDA